MFVRQCVQVMGEIDRLVTSKRALVLVVLVPKDRKVIVGEIML